MSTNKAVITLGGGCFWCLEAVYDDLAGVLDVVSGYSGGKIENPTYQQVTSGRTSHAEVVQITFDSEKISIQEILHVFFSIHDPTTLNRQGNDVGTQYRSVIYYNDENQANAARELIQGLGEQGVWRDPIVTELKSFQAFYPAEEYHQEYFKRNPYQGYCQYVVAPKVAKFRKQFSSSLHLNDV